MVNYIECFKYYQNLLLECDEQVTHDIVLWYQNKARFYLDEING